MMVKGIQSEAVVNMWGFVDRREIVATVPGIANAVNLQDCIRHPPSSSLRKQGGGVTFEVQRLI